jgi:hypothetical protein
VTPAASESRKRMSSMTALGSSLCTASAGGIAPSTGRVRVSESRMSVKWVGRARVSYQGNPSDRSIFRS